ncbi:MAG TPA: carbohydrate binding domain-containing protein [Gaiellaceae bacterium]|nr:carbohydrate binding domain-containing protein [Gaiellaceae bacterium]
MSHVTDPTDAYAAQSPALRGRPFDLSRPLVRRAVTALTIGCIAALAVLKAGGVESHLASDVLGGVLVVAFIALTLVDFRASVAVTIFELVLGGAGGHWIDYGSLSGRIFLIFVVTVRAAWLTIADWRRGIHPVLGRYGAHALAIAILIPLIWIPLGLADGNGRHDVVADGNGFLFFAFVLVVMTLVRRGEGAWLRRLFFAACATNAVAYFALIVLAASGALSLASVHEWLAARLDMGGVIGYMPNGDFRLFTAGSLFLVVGLVLTAQRLLLRPRDLLLWLLGGILAVDLIATYTRGLWLSALLAVALVLALEARSLRQLSLGVVIPAAAGGLALAIAPLLGFSLYGYVFNRAATITSSGQPTLQGRVANPGFERSLSGWKMHGVSPRPPHVLRTAVAARTGTHSLQLSNARADADAYAFQNLTVKPKTTYAVSAWVNARGFRVPAAGSRGLFVWDAQDGLVYTVPLTQRTHGWEHLSFTFPTRKQAGDIQIRLYSPEGRVLWDDVRLVARGRAGVGARAAGGRVQVARIPATSASQTQALGATGGGGGGDTAGEASNAYKVAEAKALWGYIKQRPILGYGFGKVASDFSTGYSYELSYLDLFLKAGIVGLLFYLSFPLRLIVDGLRLRRPLRALPENARGVGTAGVVVGVVAGILAAGATNPYLFAAFGLVSILVLVAWLEEAWPVGGEPPA